MALPSTLPTPTLSLVPPSGSIYLGVFVNPSQEPSPPPSLLSSFETSIGRTVAVSMHYYGFYDSFPGAYESDDEAHGRIPLDSWDCQPSNAAIASGADDAAIRVRADALKAFGRPIFMRYMWEMNLPATSTFRNLCYDPSTDQPNGVFSPQHFIAAWDRIRAIFAEEDVTNVVWVWNPSGANDPLSYYPGALETDWVGSDSYDAGNVSLAAMYQHAYAWLTPLGKPLMIGETGALQQEQAAFFGSAASTLQTQFPLVKAFVYFDSENVNEAGNYNWVIGSSTLSDFAAMAVEPYFSAAPP
jgi:hypothetical protein